MVDPNNKVLVTILCGAALLLYTALLVFWHPKPSNHPEFDKYDDQGKYGIKQVLKFVYPVAVLAYLIFCAHNWKF